MVSVPGVGVITGDLQHSPSLEIISPIPAYESLPTSASEACRSLAGVTGPIPSREHVSQIEDGEEVW